MRWLYTKVSLSSKMLLSELLCSKYRIIYTLMLQGYIYIFDTNIFCKFTHGRFENTRENRVQKRTCLLPTDGTDTLKELHRVSTGGVGSVSD